MWCNSEAIHSPAAWETELGARGVCVSVSAFEMYVRIHIYI